MLNFLLRNHALTKEGGGDGIMGKVVGSVFGQSLVLTQRNRVPTIGKLGGECQLLCS